MALRFNGTNQALNSASAIVLTGNSISISCWIKNLDSYVDLGIWLELGANFNPAPAGTKRFALFSGGGDFDWNQRDGSVGYSLIENNTAPSGSVWHHYLCVVDGDLTSSEVNGWVDGAAFDGARSLDVDTTSDWDNDEVLYVAARSTASLFAQIDLAYLAIWDDTVLTAGDASALMRAAPDQIGNNPDWYWSFDSGSLTADIGGVDMQAVNSPTTVAQPSFIGGSGNKFDLSMGNIRI